MRILLVVLALALAVPLVSTLRAEEEAGNTASFPWLGTWRGPGRVLAPGRPDLTFTMELRIEPRADDDGYAWTIAFRDHAGGTEEYEDEVYRYVLRPIDAEQGHWLMDQQDSIEIDCFRLGDALYSRFDLAGNVLSATYEVRDGGIDFRSANFGRAALRVSGGKEGAPEVASFGLRSVQQARMTKVEEAGGK